MTDAELAAMAKAAKGGTILAKMNHIAAWTPERALAALAVIESVRAITNLARPRPGYGVTETLAAWDALP